MLGGVLFTRKFPNSKEKFLNSKEKFPDYSSTLPDFSRFVTILHNSWKNEHQDINDVRHFKR